MTIFALLIIVLIVAIILTSVVLDDKTDKQSLLEENDTEMVSPELTLTNVAKVKKPKAEPKLNEIIEEELNKPIEAKKVPVTLERKPVAEIKTEVPKPTEPEPEEIKPPTPVVETTPEPESVTIDDNYEQTPEPVETEKVEAPEVVVPVLAEKPVKKSPEKVVSSTSTYYIQVGAFSQKPSKRFLSVITNSGFTYKITAANSRGSKKLLVGPYPDKKSANVALVRVKDRINKSAFVTKQ